MKIARILLIGFLSLSLFSCTQKSQSEKNNDSSLQSKVEKTDSVVQLVTGEDFYAFLDDFSNDEMFQLKRVVFPITATIPDVGHQGMAPKEEVISKYDWEPLDLTYDSTFLTRSYDQYYQTVSFVQDTAVVEIRGINNGIYADYYFKLIDNEWHLVTMSEASF